MMVHHTLIHDYHLNHIQDEAFIREGLHEDSEQGIQEYKIALYTFVYLDLQRF